MRIITAIVIGFGLFCTTGCATLMRGNSQGMTFNTDPQGATVVVSDGEQVQTFTTPKKVELKRKEKYAVEISKPGYRNVKFDLKPQWDGAAIGNLIMPGGSVGAATDTANGADKAFYKLETVKLPKQTAANEPPLELTQWRGKLYTPEEYQERMKFEEQYRKDMATR